jgi:hypothetical protein
MTMKAPPTEMILQVIVSVFKRGTRTSLIDIKDINGDEQSFLGTQRLNCSEKMSCDISAFVVTTKKGT